MIHKMINDMNRIEDLSEQILQKCRFCNPPERERILWETEHFYVMVSLGPIVEGYLLIVTKSHIGACLNIPEELLQEFLMVKGRVKDILTSTYGGCMFYEHGKAGSSLLIDGHIHCYHAHLHCFPMHDTLHNDVSLDYSPLIFDSFEDAYINNHVSDKYLLIEDDKLYVYQPSDKPRSQYLRFKLACHIGHPERWDWINNQNWEMIDDTVKRLKPYFV